MNIWFDNKILYERVLCYIFYSFTRFNYYFSFITSIYIHAEKNEINTFPVIANNIELENIEKKGFIRVVAFIGGQPFTEHIQLSGIKIHQKIL